MPLPGTKDGCKHEAGVFRPVINRARCEGKEDCLHVCPFDVFEVRKLTLEEKAELSAFARFRLFVHGGQQAFAVRENACRGCGLCVAACPEQAITLRRVDAALLSAS